MIFGKRILYIANNRKIIIGILMVWQVFVVQSLLAQPVIFHHLMSEHGLSTNAIVSITQDADGFMWFGTPRGLNRFDGKKMVIYQKENPRYSGLYANYINALYRDSKKNLWIGTGWGLNRYDEENDVFLQVRVSANEKEAISCIVEDASGKMWIGARSGLYAFEKNDTGNVVKFTGEHGKSLTGGAVTTICQDYQGDLWVGSSKGLIRIWRDKTSYYFEQFRKSTDHQSGISDDNVSVVFEDQHKNLWVGTQHGLNLFDRSTKAFRQFFHHPHKDSLIHNNIRTLVSNGDDELWVGTQDGLSILNLTNHSFTSFQNDGTDVNSLSQNSIYSLYKDANASIWVGTYFGGVNRVDSLFTEFRLLKNDGAAVGIRNNVFSSMVEDTNHNAWLATEGGGMIFYDPAKGDYNSIVHKASDPKSIGSNQIKVLYHDSDQNLWCGTHNGGLNVLDKNTMAFTRYLEEREGPNNVPKSIRAIVEDKEQNLWIATQLGVRIFKRNGNQLGDEISSSNIFPSFDTLIVNVIIKDSRSRVWLGGIGGVYVIDNGVAQHIYDAEFINTIFEDSNGNIWVGMPGSGLAMFNPLTNKLDVVAEIQADVKEVFAILEDDYQNLWLSSTTGIHRFSSTTLQLVSYNNFDGVVDREFVYNSALKSHSGEMLFGGMKGVTRFFPDRISVNQYKAPIAFTGLTLNGENVPIGDGELLNKSVLRTSEVRFGYNQRVFTVGFALLNYVKTDKNRYAYQLSGVDDKWNYTYSNSITYNNLSAGKYKLMVKGANNDGVWSDPIEMSIRVLPPPWKSWWAYSIYIFLILGLIFLLTRFIFLRALLKREEDLHQVKMNFFTNVSHELRTHLSLIVSPVEKLLEHAGMDEFTKSQLSTIKGNSDRLLRLVNELLDFRKVDSNNQTLIVSEHSLVPFLEDICRSFEALTEQKGIALRLHTSGAANVRLYFDETQMEKVFFNLLGNALKFTPRGGRIDVTVNNSEAFTEVEVADTGKGIPEAYLSKLFTSFYQVTDYGKFNTGYGLGLALSRGIIKLHHGDIQVESKSATDIENGYTIFRVKFISGNSHFKNDNNATIVEGGPETDRDAPLQTADVMASEPHLQGVAKKQVKVEGSVILVVEDNNDLRALLVQNLKDYYEVYEAADGKAGLLLATEIIPDLIISDVMMPETDGYQLAQFVKNDERTSHIPLILLTAKSTTSNQHEGLEKGADIYLTKPFSVSLLLLNVRNLLSTRKLMQQKVLREVVVLNADLSEESHRDEEDTFLRSVISIIESHIDDETFSVEKLAKKMGMSQPVLYKKVRAVTNLSVNELIKIRKFRRAATLILEGKLRINEVAYAVGYDDRKYFSKEFKRYFGVTPSEFTEDSIKTNMMFDMDKKAKG